MRVTRKSLDQRVQIMRDSFGLPPVYVIDGAHAQEDDRRAYWPQNLEGKVALWGAGGKYKGRRLTDYMSLRTFDAYLDGFTDALHFARRFAGLRRPGLHIGNWWADYVLGLIAAEKKEAAEQFGVEVVPAYPWRPQSDLVPFGRIEGGVP